MLQKLKKSITLQKSEYLNYAFSSYTKINLL